MAKKADWARVGRRIRRLRTERGLTQVDLAGKRVTAAAISMVESGTRRPSKEVLAYIADRLGTTEDYLLTGRDPGVETRLRLEVEQARLKVHQGRAEDVLADLDRIEGVARRADLRDARAAALEVRGKAMQKLGRFEAALKAYDDAMKIREKEPVERQVVARCGRARCLYLTGDVHYSVHVLEVLLVELRRSPAPDPTALATVYSALVGPYFKSGLVEKAREAVEEAHRLGTRVSDPEVIGCMNVNVGGMRLAEGRVDDAIRALAKAEDCFAQLEWSDELGTTRIAQAMGFIDKEDWPEARAHLMSALDVLAEIPDPTMRATALNQLGRVERIMGDVDQAEGHLHEALELVSDGSPNERGLAQRELGLCAAAHGDVESARSWLLRAVDSYRAASNHLQVGRTYKEIAELEAEHGDPQALIELYREGLEAATAPAL